MLTVSISIYPPNKSPIMVEYPSNAGIDEIIEDLKHRFEITGYNLKKVLIKGRGGTYEVCPQDYPRVVGLILPRLGFPVAICGVLGGEKGELVISLLLEEMRYERAKSV